MPSKTQLDYAELLANPAYHDALEGIRASLYREFKSATNSEKLVEILQMVKTVDRFDQIVKSRASDA